MKIAVIYESLTGNTEIIAKAVKEAVCESVVYFGNPSDDAEADFYFVGSWTDKGMCCEKIESALKKIENKKIAYFATAGFGGSDEYYSALAKRVENIIPNSNKFVSSFICQGKMPMSVRERYVSMMREHPDDKKLEVSIENFDNALSHPNETDLQNAKKWAIKCITENL